MFVKKVILFITLSFPNILNCVPSSLTPLTALLSNRFYIFCIVSRAALKQYPQFFCKQKKISKKYRKLKPNHDQSRVQGIGQVSSSAFVSLSLPHTRSLSHQHRCWKALGMDMGRLQTLTNTKTLLMHLTNKRPFLCSIFERTI